MRQLVAAAAAGVLGAAAAAGAAVQTGSSAVPLASANAAPPITIASCSVDALGTLENPRLGYRPAVADTLKIVYRNERDASATDVRFVVRYAGKVLAFDDRGNFAPQAGVDHDFTLFNTIYTGERADCSVASATFADGSHWAAGAGGAAAPR